MGLGGGCHGLVGGWRRPVFMRLWC
jgi:hypothetical protein